MTQLPHHYTDKHTGISYTLIPDGSYYIPDLEPPEEQEYEIGAFGLMRRSHLKNHHKGLFTTLLTSGKLNEHLAEIDQTANSRMEQMTKQIAERENVTEQLKADNQMLWIQKMTNIRNRVLEIINNDLIFS
jgi:hypothetical protein